MLRGTVPLALLALALAIAGRVTHGQALSSQSTASAFASASSSSEPQPETKPHLPPRPKPTAPSELPTPMCYPKDFNSIVEKECGERKHLPPKLKKSAPRRSRKDCETAVTARELQKAIRQAEPICVAQILIQSNSVKGIEEGYRIPPDFNFVPNFGFREKDPDVVALKGLALGVLQGDRDKKLVPKLVAAMVPAFSERAGEKIEEKKPIHPRKKGETTTTCSTSVTTKTTENSFSSSKIQKCKEETPYKPPARYEVDSARFEASLRDRVLLRDVFTADPNEPNTLDVKYAGDVGRRLLELPSRKLQCSSCENGNSYTCSFCWEADFCSQFRWCPPNV